MVRAFVVTLTTVLTLASAVGCDVSRLQPDKPKPSASATSAAPEYLGEPKVGDCHKLTFKDIAEESDTKKPVDCSDKHTTRTVAVVTAPAAATRGSNNAQAYAVGKACGAALTEILGADAETRAKTLALRVEDDPAARLRAVRELAELLDEVKDSATGTPVEAGR